MRSSSIDVVWFGMVFQSFISSFGTFPGGGGGGGGGSLKSKIQLTQSSLTGAGTELGNL